MCSVLGGMRDLQRAPSTTQIARFLIGKKPFHTVYYDTQRMKTRKRKTKFKMKTGFIQHAVHILFFLPPTVARIGNHGRVVSSFFSFFLFWRLGVLVPCTLYSSAFHTESNVTTAVYPDDPFSSTSAHFVTTHLHNVHN